MRMINNTKYLLLIITISLISCKHNSMMKNDQFIKINNNLKLWVETYGNPENEACLFINGAGANSSFWSERLCSTLVDNGFYIIKYDHRDFGFSQKLDFETIKNFDDAEKSNPKKIRISFFIITLFALLLFDYDKSLLTNIVGAIILFTGLSPSIYLLLKIYKIIN